MDICKSYEFVCCKRVHAKKLGLILMKFDVEVTGTLNELVGNQPEYTTFFQGVTMRATANCVEMEGFIPIFTICRLFSAVILIPAEFSVSCFFLARIILLKPSLNQLFVVHCWKKPSTNSRHGNSVCRLLHPLKTTLLRSSIHLRKSLWDLFTSMVLREIWSAHDLFSSVISSKVYSLNKRLLTR